MFCCVEGPLDESGKLNIRKEENAVCDQRSGKTTKSSVVKVTVIKCSFAPTFPLKDIGHSTKGITAGGGMTSKQIKTCPGVAVAVANGGSNPEEHSMDSERLRADAANLVTIRDETKAKSIPSTNANQPVTGPNGVGKGTLKAKYCTETADEDKSSVNSPLNKDRAGGITHPRKIKEADTLDDGHDDSGESSEKNVPDIVWASTNKTNLRRVVTLQKCAIIINKSNFDARTDPIYKGWFSLAHKPNK